MYLVEQVPLIQEAIYGEEYNGTPTTEPPIYIQSLCTLVQLMNNRKKNKIS
jgi:hypothetical protein